MAALREYHRKRDFGRTPEPRGDGTAGRDAHRFVVQKHAASRLHYDFRLELDGTLKSWAVPKGPSLDPSEKRLAMQTEDHPLEYAAFEGVIPKDEYGGGSVVVWDHGTWQPIDDPRAGVNKGRLAFTLDGEKLKGRWSLVQIRGRGARDAAKSWLLTRAATSSRGRRTSRRSPTRGRRASPPGAASRKSPATRIAYGIRIARPRAR
jgi:bifunctional non-homologous end joining protein LigD